MRFGRVVCLLGMAAGLSMSAGHAVGQEPAGGARASLQVGDVAPEFALPAATRYGVLAEPVRLSDFAGSTVVLSFFFRARTKG